MKTLELFNAVVKGGSTDDLRPYVDNELGLVIEPSARHHLTKIFTYYKNEKLSGNDLNKTFHKSWEKIKSSTRYELFIEQIKHYLSTYGSDFKSEVYIPDEVLNVPELKGLKLKYKVIKGLSVKEMTEKCLDLLKSGIALKQETIESVLSILNDELDYTFTGNEGIKNKEVIVKIADLYGVFPNDVMEFFRYIIYRSTDNTLLIKNKETIELIKKSGYNPGAAFKKFGLEKLSAIFNRFKPLFLAYKGKCPKTINKLSKLSKKYHKPLISNPLNMVTNTFLETEDVKWLEKATPYALFKALVACYSRVNGQDSFVYRIRNGKSWVQSADKLRVEVCNHNYEFILLYLKTKFDFSDRKVFLPKNVKFALPTSEKMFVGNIPTGTRFYGKKMAVGIYWENSWGANDLDLSGLNIGGKVGWNSAYNQNDGKLMYSGDLTSAPNGAVEYLYASKGLKEPTLVLNNVYSGSTTCDYKIVVGKGGKVSREYMMNPNNLFMEAKCQSIQKQSVLGMIIPKKDKQCFVLLNFGAGHARVSGNNEITGIAIKALYQQWNKPYTFNKLLKELGVEIVDTVEESDYDFSLEALERDTFIKFFE